jgi:hypothetical protein
MVSSLFFSLYVSRTRDLRSTRTFHPCVRPFCVCVCVCVCLLFLLTLMLTHFNVCVCYLCFLLAFALCVLFCFFLQVGSWTNLLSGSWMVECDPVSLVGASCLCARGKRRALQGVDLDSVGLYQSPREGWLQNRLWKAGELRRRALLQGLSYSPHRVQSKGPIAKVFFFFLSYVRVCACVLCVCG